MRKVFPTVRRPLLPVEVVGESMLPALRPGDLLLVRPGARAGIGDVVVARHPLRPGRLIIKRITHRTAQGWWLESDNQRAPGRQDSWDFDAVPHRLVIGRPVARYWPPSRWSLWPKASARRADRAEARAGSGGRDALDGRAG